MPADGNRGVEQDPASSTNANFRRNNILAGIILGASNTIRWFVINLAVLRRIFQGGWVNSFQSNVTVLTCLKYSRKKQG